MKKLGLSSVAASIFAAFLAPAASAVVVNASVDEGAKTWVRDVNAGNAGVEIIAPVLALNAGKTSVSVRFNIFPVASGVKLYSTATAAINLPAAASCAMAIEAEGWIEGEYFINNTHIIVSEIERWCYDDGMGGFWNTTDLVAFGADVSQNNGAIWTKIYGNTGGGSAFADTTGDGVPELLLNKLNNETAVVTTAIFNPVTGATITGFLGRATATGFNYWAF